MRSHIGSCYEKSHEFKLREAIWLHIMRSLKPIFHCDAKLLALGTFALPDTKDDTFALPDAMIPTCWYLLRWVTHIFCVLPNTKPKSYVLTDAKPKRKPVEYRLRWVPGVGSLRWACTFHIFCVDFICIGWPTQTHFSVEYGLYCFILGKVIWSYTMQSHMALYC